MIFYGQNVTRDIVVFKGVSLSDADRLLSLAQGSWQCCAICLWSSCFDSVQSSLYWTAYTTLQQFSHSHVDLCDPNNTRNGSHNKDPDINNLQSVSDWTTPQSLNLDESPSGLITEEAFLKHVQGKQSTHLWDNYDLGSVSWCKFILVWLYWGCLTSLSLTLAVLDNQWQNQSQNWLPTFSEAWVFLSG